MGFSINFDWSEELNGENFDKWENLGRQFAEESCTHKTQDNGSDKETNMRYSGWCEECGYYEDSCKPMMNYAYPLEIEPNEEAIRKTIENTNSTVMYNNHTNEHFLVLCGGGMNLSQDIALAYIYCQKWIPEELLNNVCNQKGLSVGGENWKFLRSEMISQFKHKIGMAERYLKEWEETEE